MTIPSGGPLMLIVLLILVLAIAVYVINRNVKANREAISQIKQEKETPQVSASQADAPVIQTEEEAAAFIALHLYLSQAVHDRESGVITIERIERRYSPWNSKIYNMNNILR